ncbi:DDE-type integrase/transposase/recombinase [Parasedimentitalea psychrophila]|uniref:DDE-type integrase/transposase/recombinase n=1 Tax=Parasedimentitalea psychrophila TaxID=2997337 RepID=A0A9Y2L3X4_9RHOB|nr:DDE-type integrase/transposase/recombinase [Parasedimentitalea psychrophila]WIY27534.1 DDE-type integrase/transposase/recombinase [Parasedimentitalea psychrophila]
MRFQWLVANEPRPCSRTLGYFTPVHERGTKWDARDQRLVIREARDLELLPKIKAFFKASGKCYGSKRIHQDLMADGEIASERRVAIIMKENKVSPLLRKRRKPVTTDRNHKLRPSPNLLEQNFHCQTPNTVWLADITYLGTDEGWLYLAGIKDMATREIVGWAMEGHMRAELCCDALKMALGRRGPVPGLIHHSPSRDHAAHNPAGQWTGPVPLSFRPLCSFRRRSFQKPRDFSSLMPSVSGGDYRTH